jgi:hypothetical protein
VYTVYGVLVSRDRLVNTSSQLTCADGLSGTSFVKVPCDNLFVHATRDRYAKQKPKAFEPIVRLLAVQDPYTHAHAYNRVFVPYLAALSLVQTV